MKHNTKDKNSDFEIAAVAFLNADLNRFDYPTLSTEPAKLAQVVGSAIQGRNRFQLCLEVAKLARKLHNPYTTTIQATITDALVMLSQPVAKPVVCALAVGVAA